MDNKIINFFKNQTDKELSQLTLEKKAALKSRIMHAVQANPEQQPASKKSFTSKWSHSWHNLSSSIFMKGYVFVPLVVLIMVVSTTAVSANALPGDLLYPVKRQVESARLLLAPSNEAKLELELNFAEERLKELDNIRTIGPTVSVQGQEDKNNDSGDSKTPRSNSSNNKDDDHGQDSEHRNHNRGTSSISQQQPERERDSEKDDREERARKEAEKALDLMEKAKEKYREDKAEKRAEDLNKKIEDYRKKMEKDLEDSLEIKFERNGNSGKGNDRNWDNKTKERLFD